MNETELFEAARTLSPPWLVDYPTLPGNAYETAWRAEKARDGTVVSMVNGATTSFTDATTQPSTVYDYTVTASDAAGNTSDASDEAEATTPAATPPPDTTAPSVPTDLAATATSSTQIDLTWTASTDDTAVSGYNLYRDGTLIAVVGSNSWFDTGLAPLSAHTYTVAVFDGSANTSEASTPASATTGATPPASVSYAYDLADRLAAITTASGSTTTFGFDALGRHASQTIGTTTQTYSYLGTSQVVVAITAGSSTTRSAIDAVGDRVATSGAGVAGFLLADLHGNTAGALNSSCTAITDAFAYDAYGNTVAAVTTALPTPWRYQGRMLESATGTPDLYDFGSRSYSPTLGTFTGLDTMHGSAQNPALLNGYLYANANPATLVDPDGHCVITSDNLDGCGNNYSASVTARAAVYETEGFKQAVAFKRQLDQLVNTVANKLRTGAEQYESDNDCWVHRPLCDHELSNLERYAGVSFTTDSETGATFRYNRDYAAASDADGWTAYNNCKLNPSDTAACAVSAKGNYVGQSQKNWNMAMTSTVETIAGVGAVGAIGAACVLGGCELLAAGATYAAVNGGVGVGSYTLATMGTNTVRMVSGENRSLLDGWNASDAATAALASIALGPIAKLSPFAKYPLAFGVGWSTDMLSARLSSTTPNIGHRSCVVAAAAASVSGQDKQSANSFVGTLFGIILGITSNLGC